MARERTLAKREPAELTTLEPWDTFREMERMFHNFFSAPFGLARRRWLTQTPGQYAPEVDLRETDQQFVLSAVVPGMTKDDINIDVTTDSVSISGERKTEEDKPGERYHVRQQSYGRFDLCYSLPSDVKPDEVKATYKNGILEVVMPKAEAKETRKVRVEAES